MEKGTITLVIAVVGAVTGILGLVFNFLNTWRAFDRDRVKLKVVPRLAMFFTMGQRYDCLSIDVVNLGFVPVTVSRVVLPIDSEHELHFTQHPQYKVELPRRLEPRESVTIMATPDLQLNPQFASVLSARASTACGRHFDGTSPALKSFVKKARNNK
jgi:hypothetical protein